VRFVPATSGGPFWLVSLLGLSALLAGCAGRSTAAADRRDGGLPRCPLTDSAVPSGAQFVHMARGTHQVLSGMNRSIVIEPPLGNNESGLAWHLSVVSGAKFVCGNSGTEQSGVLNSSAIAGLGPVGLGTIQLSAISDSGRRAQLTLIIKGS
jgi:hypothetical protein